MGKHNASLGGAAQILGRALKSRKRAHDLEGDHTILEHFNKRLKMLETKEEERVPGKSSITKPGATSTPISDPVRFPNKRFVIPKLAGSSRPTLSRLKKENNSAGANKDENTQQTKSHILNPTRLGLSVIQQVDDDLQIVEEVPGEKMFELGERWIHPKKTIYKRFIYEGGRTRSRNMLQNSLQRISKGGNQTKISNSGLEYCYQLRDKQLYKELMERFKSRSFITTTSEQSQDTSRSSSVSLWDTVQIRKRKDRVDFIDLTISEDKEVKEASRVSLTVIRDKECIPRTSSSIRSESPEEIVCLGAVSSPRKNDLDEILSKNSCFDESFIPKMKQSFEQRKRVRDRQIEDSKIRARLASEQGRKLFEDELEDRVRRQMLITTLEPEVVDEEEEVEILPALSPEAEEKVNKALHMKPPNEILVSAYNKEITRRDINTLSGLNWLNDEIINFYMDLLMERGKLDNYPNVHTFNTFFYPKLRSGGHSVLKRWTKKVDIFSYDMIVVPIHLGMHWCMSLVDLTTKTITYYDSMGGGDNGCTTLLLQYLQAESLDKKKVTLDVSDWKTVLAKNIPQQMNGSDCGMFSCMFAEYLSRRAPITFSQEDMPYFRRRMVYEILTCKLMT